VREAVLETMQAEGSPERERTVTAFDSEETAVDV